MRLLILKDTTISTRRCLSLTEKFSAFLKKYTGIKSQIFIEDIDYSNVPTEADSRGHLKPTREYLTVITDRVHEKYGNWGVDHVVILVDDDNWVFKGINGTNWSNIYRTYHIHLCRARTLSVSFGTLYHEWMHSLDAIIKTHTGFNINTLFADMPCYVSWDTSWVHGNRGVSCANSEFVYIRGADSIKALRKIAPHLKRAYEVRRQMYYQPLITVQLQVISWLRSLLNKKDGVSPFVLK